MTQMRRGKRLRAGTRGMTLIEIMVVITILGLIAGAVTVLVIPRLEEGKVSAAKIKISNLKNELDQYYARKGKYPDTGTGLKALVDGQYEDSMPKDPWGNEYVYTLENGKAVVVSYGKDGQPGGESNDADISSKDLNK